MSNPFDQFDEPSPEANPFDQFDAKTPSESKLASMQPKDGAIGHSIDDQLHSTASSMYHGAVGGYKGIGELLAGHGIDDAADAVNAETAKAYQAPDSVLKSAMESKYNPLNYVQEGADYLADKAEKYPLLATAIKSAPTALGAVTGVVGLARNPTLAIGRGFRNKPPAIAAPADLPAIARNPEDVIAQANAGQNMGAASVPIDISNVSPELRDAVGKTDPDKLHAEALNRHARAETLPLPSDMTPLRLRKGQATRDAQQISDEKNLRGDQDTGGLLADSISDQSKKLGASFGEIHQRALPETVQRTDAEHDQSAIDAIKSQDNNTVTDIRAKYKELADQNGGDMPIDTELALKEIKPILKQKSLRNTVAQHPYLSEVMEGLSSDDPISFETFEDWRTGLAEIQRGTDGRAATAAGIIHNTLNNMPLTEEAAPLRDLADTARNAAAARFNTIELNPAYKAAIEDNTPRDAKTKLHVIGAPSPLAGSFLDRFATGKSQNASPAYVERLKQAVPNPDLHNAMEGVALNKLRNAAGINPLGEGNFKVASYGKAVDNLADKAHLLMKPDTVENINHLKNVADDVNWEDPSSTTNRSNTMVTLNRFGAAPTAIPTRGSMGSQAAHMGAGAILSHIPGGHIIHAVGDTLMSRHSDAKAKAAQAAAEQSVRDAKLKFAQDAVKPGAGIEKSSDTTPIARASGGRVSHDELVNRLMKKWKEAKKATDETTKPLLNVHDSVIAKALDVAQRSI